MTDNQFDQIFGLLTKTVNGVQNLENEVQLLKQGQDELRQDVNSLKQDVSELKQGQSELREDVNEIKQGQDELRREFNEFRDETQQNFVEVKQELKHQNHKIELVTQDSMENRAVTKDIREWMVGIESRVEKLEEKRAA